MSDDDFGGADPASESFSVISIDPPWPERGGGKIKRGADKHYKLAKNRAEILAIILQSPTWRPADNAHLYLWTTMSSLVNGLWVMDGLGFKYTTHGVWVKSDDPGVEVQVDTSEEDEGLETTDVSIGQYFRGEHEVFLFGTRGKGFAVRTPDKSIRSVIYARTPRGADGKRRHSAKPQKFYDMVERRSIGPKLEMFARDPRPGWTVWGNEV